MLLGALSACEDKARAAPPAIKLRRFTKRFYTWPACRVIGKAPASRRNLRDIFHCLDSGRNHPHPHYERGALARRAAHADLRPMRSRNALRNRKPEPVSFACTRFV